MNEHAAVAEVQSPLKPSECEPVAGVAVRVISLASNSFSEQSAPHEIPGPVTVPAPLPSLVMLTSVRGRQLGVAVVLAFSRKAQLVLAAPPTRHVTPVQLVKP